MAQAEMNRLNGAFIIAKNNNNHAIKSPFSGIITKIYPKEGDFIFGGGGMAKPSPVFHVVDPEQIIIKATISGSLLPFLDSNKAVEIVGNHHKVSGKIISHDKVINPATGTITCTIQPSNSKSLIFGSTVYVNIKHTFANVFSVPYNTILLDEDGLTYVKLLNGEQKVIKKLVNIVHEESNGTVLISNLKNNDKVIIKGQYLAELDSIVPQASVQTAV
jgi:multidrug resistance efflux pump